MAELILTDEERRSKCWLELDDATLGKVVKATALKIEEGDSEERLLTKMSAALLLCADAHKLNATTARFEVKGVTYKDASIGDWAVTVERLDT